MRQVQRSPSEPALLLVFNRRHGCLGAAAKYAAQCNLGDAADTVTAEPRSNSARTGLSIRKHELDERHLNTA